jgi:ATPase family protein associated with various cellular activities (AAA)/winged helix domain-containing protein
MAAIQSTERLNSIGNDSGSADVSRASILELVLMRVRLRARRRAAWLAHLGGGSIAETLVSFDATVQACLDDRDTCEAESAWLNSAADVQPINDKLAKVEQALAGEAGTGLRHFTEMFRLSEAEVDLLQTCLAPAVDPALGTVYAYLQHHHNHNYATEGLAARLFGYEHRSMWSPGCPLAGWGFVTAGDAATGEPVPLVVDPVVVAWLQGELRIDAALASLIRIVQQRKPLDSWPVDEAVRIIRRGIDRELTVRLMVVGPSSSGRRTFTAAVAAQFGIQTFGVDTSQITDSDWPNLFMRAQRLGVLGGTALVWHGSGLHRRWPSDVSPGPIQFVTCDVAEVIPPCGQVIDHRIELPIPTLEERRGLWKASIPESITWPSGGFETLVERYRLSAGDIMSVSRRAPISPREAAEFSRELTRHRLGDLARLLDCPFTWADLVVTSRLREALEDFAFEARERAMFWESPNAQRMFPRGTGLVALFSGPPGTGKTMATQVIAADLELDLFRIDLAAAVSKYIGETAKHLAQIFARAARMNAVLLFDEADALFSKRTEVKDAHDRYANADTSYLLQLLEEYSGIVILASNKKQNIDPAFIRRVRYVMEFPRPDAPERRRIWRQVIGELSGPDTLSRLEATIEALAVNAEISGAQIKNAVLASLFGARRSREPLAMIHLLRGLERELSNEGRALGTRERERLVRDG